MNQPLTPGAAAIQQRRPYPFFGGITLRDPGANASYNAFTAKAEKRFSQGMTFLLSYTWSHAIDDGAGTLNDGAGSFRDNFNLAWTAGTHSTTYGTTSSQASSTICPSGAAAHMEAACIP